MFCFCKQSKQSGSENINRSEAYRELASIINDRVGGKVQTLKGMETPLSEFIAQTKADALGASLSKFANQDHASQRLYEVLRDMPEVLEKKFAEPSFDFFGDAEVKALKSVDMYDFLDYMIGRGQQNQATSELKDALIGLKKLESSLPNNTPPSTPNPPSPNNTPPSPNNQNTPTSTPNANNPSNTNNTPPTKPSTQANATKESTQASTTKANAENPTATKANDSTQPKQSDQANADNAGQVANNADSSTKNDMLSQSLDTISPEKTQKGQAMQKYSLKEKTTSDLSKEELDKLPLATVAEFSDFLEKISQKDYKNTPKILKIATLNDTLKKVINKNHNANVFITRSRAWHISKERKDLYNQALRTDEQAKIPSIIKNADEVFVGGGSGFVIPFKDIKNADKINLIVLDSDNKGNFLITAKKINKIDFEKGEYQKASKDGS